MAQYKIVRLPKNEAKLKLPTPFQIPPIRTTDHKTKLRNDNTHTTTNNTGTRNTDDSTALDFTPQKDTHSHTDTVCSKAPPSNTEATIPTGNTLATLDSEETVVSVKGMKEGEKRVKEDMERDCSSESSGRKRSVSIDTGDLMRRVEKRSWQGSDPERDTKRRKVDLGIVGISGRNAEQHEDAEEVIVVKKYKTTTTPGPSKLLSNSTQQIATRSSPSPSNSQSKPTSTAELDKSSSISIFSHSSPTKKAPRLSAPSKPTPQPSAPKKLTPKVILKNGEACVDQYPHFLSSKEAHHYLNRLQNEVQWATEKIKIFGKVMDCKRMVAYYGEPGISYKYSGFSRQTTGWIPVIEEIKSKVEEALDLKFNYALMLNYADGNEYIGWHADDESDLQPNSTIASVSFGAQRDFQFRHKKTKAMTNVVLNSGCLLTMYGNTQKNYKHQLPKRAKVQDRRINITFRQVFIK